MLQLRDYQQRAVDKTREAIRHGKKQVVTVAPTGAGKSLIIAEIFRLASQGNKKCLFIVHRRNLVLQIKETLESFNLAVGVIMNGYESNLSAQCQVATIQTYSRRLNLDELSENRFFIDADLLVIDEAHTSVSKRTQDVLEHYRDKVIVGFTATPCRRDGRGLGEVFSGLVNVIGMKELIGQGYLAEPRYYVPTEIDLAGIKKQAGDYQEKALSEKMSQAKLVGDIVDQWIKLGENRATLVFAVDVKHAKHISDRFNQAGIPASYLHAKSSEDERDRAFQQMEDGVIRVMVNVLLYVEGMDAPNISCVVMARPTKSLGMYRQSCGRGLRPKSIVNDCIILDHGGVVAEHGLLEEDIIWSLDGKEKAWQKAKKKKVEKTVKCTFCHRTFQGSKRCPDCGSEVQTYGKAVETAEGELQAIKPKKVSMVEKRRWYGMLLGYAKQKGYKSGWAAHKYRERYSVWPNKMKDVMPIKPDQECKNYIKHLNIKRAKGSHD